MFIEVLYYTLSDGSVPIAPLWLTWFTPGGSCLHLQLPLKLAWSVTIHKAQGLILDKVVIDIDKKEFSARLTSVACSRICHLTDLLLNPPFLFQRVANLANSRRLQERLLEDAKLLLDSNTAPHLSSPTPSPSVPTYMDSYSPQPSMPTPRPPSVPT